MKYRHVSPNRFFLHSRVSGSLDGCSSSTWHKMVIVVFRSENQHLLDQTATQTFESASYSKQHSVRSQDFAERWCWCVLKYLSRCDPVCINAEAMNTQVLSCSPAVIVTLSAESPRPFRRTVAAAEKHNLLQPVSVEALIISIHFCVCVKEKSFYNIYLLNFFHIGFKHCLEHHPHFKTLKWLLQLTFVFTLDQQLTHK